MRTFRDYGDSYSGTRNMKANLEHRARRINNDKSKPYNAKVVKANNTWGWKLLITKAEDK